MRHPFSSPHGGPTHSAAAESAAEPAASAASDAASDGPMPPIDRDLACARPIGSTPAPDSPSLAAVTPPALQPPPTCGADAATSAGRTYPTDASKAWTAVVTLVTSQAQLSRLACTDSFPSWVNHLVNDNVVPIIFYPKVEPYFKAHPGWASQALSLRSCFSQVDGCARYATAHGHTVLTCPIDMDVPELYGGNLFSARAYRPTTFCGHHLFSGEYTVATKWFTYPMFLQPVLSRFDFWSKVDVDVCFRRQVSLGDVLTPLLRSKAVFFHAKTVNENPVCEVNLGDFMQLYARTIKAQCGDTRDPPWRAFGEDYTHPQVPYANMIGGWLGFWQAPATLHFARLWWEYEGGWSRRWGDQQYWVPALWMMGRNDSASVADLTPLRYELFRHSKDKNACGGGAHADKPPQFCLQVGGEGAAAKEGAGA